MGGEKTVVGAFRLRNPTREDGIRGDGGTDLSPQQEDIGDLCVGGGMWFS